MFRLPDLFFKSDFSICLHHTVLIAKICHAFLDVNHRMYPVDLNLIMNLFSFNLFLGKCDDCATSQFLSS